MTQGKIVFVGADVFVQNNEAEALRSWRSALDQIYYHNAYKNYVPRSETEKALQDSLRQLEVQCKERVDLLEALRRSRKEAAKAESGAAKEAQKLDKGKQPLADNPRTRGWIGEGTVPPVHYPDLSKPPALPPRPSFFTRESSESKFRRSKSLHHEHSPPLPSPPTLPDPTVKQTSRSPSPTPDHKHKKTLLTTLRTGDRKPSKPRTRRLGSQGPAPLKAAGMAWDTTSRTSSSQLVPNVLRQRQHDSTIHSRLEATAARRSLDQLGITSSEDALRGSNDGRVSDPGDYIPDLNWRDMQPVLPPPLQDQLNDLALEPPQRDLRANLPELDAAARPTRDPPKQSGECISSPTIPVKLSKPPEISYRKEFPPSSLRPVPASTASNIAAKTQPPCAEKSKTPAPPMARKVLPDSSSSRTAKKGRSQAKQRTPSGSGEDSDLRRRHRPATTSRGSKPSLAGRRESREQSPTPPSSSESSATGAQDQEQEQEESAESGALERRKAALLANLPKNVDLPTATQILNEIIVHGDEVHWSDVAGLDGAKKALKEAVVYPFLRPDLFMGLREPARGMLLFGPPGTGKTMLARAVATESQSTFFAISASSLTSKWHGESEKLVRALFAIARRMAPSIIFVDEIDSLLGTRGGSGSSEHEASRRSKTEFLIQWSDLQKAAAGKERETSGKGNGDGAGQGDPTRVLVLAATNMPWDIDEAARRRFVRRQYIPLPEAETRKVQIRTLLGHQKHELDDEDIEVLTQVTEGERIERPSHSAPRSTSGLGKLE